MNGYDIIEVNYKCVENSFMYYLHEKDMFDMTSFHELHNSIYQIKNTEVVGKLFNIYSQLLRHIICHFDPDDMSCIKNLPIDYFYYIEMLDDAINNVMDYK